MTGSTPPLPPRVLSGGRAGVHTVRGEPRTRFALCEARVCFVKHTGSRIRAVRATRIDKQDRSGSASAGHGNLHGETAMAAPSDGLTHRVGRGRSRRTVLAISDSRIPGSAGTPIPDQDESTGPPQPKKQSEASSRAGTYTGGHRSENRYSVTLSPRLRSAVEPTERCAESQRAANP